MTALAAFPVVYMPYGLCEPHGPQNVLGCDALRPAGHMRLAAEEYGGIVMPASYWHNATRRGRPPIGGIAPLATTARG